MSFFLTPGNALAIRVNAHRSAWDGSICNDPTAWSCLADPKFQERNCARGVADCFHLATFRLQDPSVVIEENGGAWIFEKDSHAFDDQILLLWTMDFEEPRGVREGAQARQIVIGAYRVKSVERVETRFGRYRVRPHPDGWTRFSGFRVATPFMRRCGGPYVQQIDRNHVQRIFRELAQESDDAKEWYSPEDARRLKHFSTHLDEWLEIGRKAEIPRAEARLKQAAVEATSSEGHTPLAGLSSLIETNKLKAGAAGRPVVVGSLAAAAAPEPPKLPQLVEPANHAWIRATYGAEVLTALQLGSLTKPLIVLRGNPGVGKSHLALRLIDDPPRQRTLVVPVSATWRGPEDLLGYVHPVDQQFAGTPFLQFLIQAETEWRKEKGDRRARVVVFEEFNLSQPEHWFSDLLALTQFEDDKDRIWRAGCKLRGAPNRSEVFISPALRFVATVNVDHTTRPLSPRILDRAAVIQLEMDPRRALELVGLQLEDAQLEAVISLDDMLADRGAGFSIRSARALAEAMRHRGTLGLDTWSVLDMALGMEMLGKVRLHARDPHDDATRKELARFKETHGRHLPRCSERIQDWLDQLQAGRDVVQA